VPERAFSICSPIPIAATGSQDQLAALDAAIAMWSAVGVAAFVRDPDAAAISVSFEPGSPAEYGYYEDGLVTVNDDLAPDATAIALAHELGHAMGLVHVSSRPSVMNPGNLQISPSAADFAAIAPCDDR
jgi:hypothetical protein